MIYGSPFDRDRQINRLLRRSRPGLVRGRSEATAPVKLPTHSELPSSQGANGAPGAPGPDGTARLSRGYRMWARPVPASGASAATIEGVLCSFSFPLGSGAIGAVTAPAANDIQGLPRMLFGPTTTSAGNRGIVETDQQFTPGTVSEDDGFSIVAQFAFSSLSANPRRWFIGLTEASGGTMSGDPSTNTGLLGVGQDQADTSPQFMHSDDIIPGTGTTKFTTGLSTVAINTVYEARLYWAPGATSAQLSFESFSGGVSSGIAAYDTGTSVQVPAAAHSWVLYMANGSSGGGTNRWAFLGFFAELHPGTAI